MVNVLSNILEVLKVQLVPNALCKDCHTLEVKWLSPIEMIDTGSLVMKSIVIFSHFHSGISGWTNKPEGLWCSALTLAQARHLLDICGDVSLHVWPPVQDTSCHGTSCRILDE
ncbi:hypothetical protein Tco_0639215 [Tanacetum coccineum]